MTACRLPVQLYTITGRIDTPLVASPYPQITRISTPFLIPYKCALVNFTLNSTIDTDFTDIAGAFLVAGSTEQSLTINPALQVLGSHFGRSITNEISLETFVDFRNFGYVLPSATPVTLYACYGSVGERVYMSANLQVRRFQG